MLKVVLSSTKTPYFWNLGVCGMKKLFFYINLSDT